MKGVRVTAHITLQRSQDAIDCRLASWHLNAQIGDDGEGTSFLSVDRRRGQGPSYSKEPQGWSMIDCLRVTENFIGLVIFLALRARHPDGKRPSSGVGSKH